METQTTNTEPFPTLENPRTPNTKSVLEASAKGSKRSPVSLTGVAAAAENKRKADRIDADEQPAGQTSPNLQVQALQSLLGGGGMSKPSDAPAPDKVSEPLQSVAEKMHVVDSAQDNALQASPVSVSSFGTIEGSGAPSAMTATAHDGPAPRQQFVAEPAQMIDGAPHHNGDGQLGVTSDQEGPKAFSYPGPPPREDQDGGPSRGMSLPGYGQSSPKSPASNKRHKCPYCSTDFTRHHNLKSHLLTHSQEKPYVCQTCQARFRRLHDLKRHTKLHTGERNHTCDKCGRKFARGDALARHNKGPGGCAGRRSSFGGEEEWGPDGPDTMDGVEYDDEGSSPDHGRRVSEPSRKRTHLETPQDPQREVYRQHSSTYPPPYHQAQQSRQHASSIGSMGPPQVVLHGQNSSGSPRDMSNATAGSSINSAYYANSSQVLPQQGMIESPKPLSPGQPAPEQQRLSVGDASMTGTYGRNRSPSLTTQFQQQHFGRGSGGRTPPQHPTQYATAHPGPPQAPLLPPLTSQPQTRSHGHAATSLAGGPGPSMLQHQQVPPASTGHGSNPGSLSSHGQSSGSSIREVLGGQDQNELWSYVRSLQQRFDKMQDEYELRISRLQQEVISLKGQLSNATGYGGDIGPARY